MCGDVTIMQETSTEEFKKLGVYSADGGGTWASSKIAASSTSPIHRCFQGGFNLHQVPLH
jgi:hypothetical protein